MTFTLNDIKKSKVAKLNPQLNSEEFHAREKYGAKKTKVDDIKFDSKKEAKRYGELKLMERQGLINSLELQVPFQLNQGGTHSLKYIADFQYYDNTTGERIIEDVKGFKNSTYRKKQKLMLKVHGITIKET